MSVNHHDEHQKCVYLLVGQRGSGKSCYGKRLAEDHPEMGMYSFFTLRGPFNISPK